MPTARVFRGVHREDWSDTSWVDGGTTVTINTEIRLEAAAALDDVDVMVILTETNGTPVVGTVVKSLVAGLLRVVFANTATAGNQMKWLAKIARNHSICR